MFIQEVRTKTKIRIGYWHLSLTRAECVYDRTQWDYLVIACAVELHRPYLMETLVTVRTYDDSLKWPLKMSIESEERARWHLRSPELGIDVVIRASLKHQAADALSTLRTDGVEAANIDDELPVCNMQNTQRTCDDTHHVQKCTECNVENKLITDRTTENPIQKGKSKRWYSTSNETQNDDRRNFNHRGIHHRTDQRRILLRSYDES